MNETDKQIESCFPAADLDRVADWLRRARSICVLTGAGMSAESGVPTFRDAAGLWSNFDPAKLATPEAFRRDPRTVWAWYRWRRGELANRQPHEGHRILAEWERRGAGVTIVTQNVDGLHHRAGSTNVIELHGRLDAARCVRCTYSATGLEDLGEDPACPACGERLRPGVVWFGELLPPGAFEAAADAVRSCDVLLVIGTSGVVYPAAGLAELARRFDKRIVEINPERTPLTPLADVHLHGGCGAALRAVEDAWRSVDS